jgi:hypothetical protein
MVPLVTLRWPNRARGLPQRIVRVVRILDTHKPRILPGENTSHWTVPSLVSSLFISSRSVGIVFPNLLFVAPLVVALLLLPASLLLAATLTTFLFLILSFPFPLISKTLLSSSLYAGPFFYFGCRFWLFPRLVPTLFPFSFPSIWTYFFD